LFGSLASSKEADEDLAYSLDDNELVKDVNASTDDRAMVIHW
jgi:hypothetical protein